MIEQSAADVPQPPFVTVQVPEGKARTVGENDRGVSISPFFDVATRTIHTYVLDGSGQTYATGILRRVKGGLSPTHLQLAKSMLSIRDHDTVTLVALGQACGLSPSHFAREFKQSTGLPPHRWALKNKIVQAKDMLLHSGHSLSAIAFACGFVDQSHLGRWFKRITGMSPKAWQRRYLGSGSSPAGVNTGR
ncbi:AraC-like DNA-binding protein [Pararobbsia alpina]|uniref:helix-turn-helix domain-containing protein n=1 Tax=Pararobbsia alpina TaxID=621374 RepID=UPI0039A67545